MDLHSDPLPGDLPSISLFEHAQYAKHFCRCSRKTKSERRGPPTFTCLIEVLDYECYRIHTRVADSVDQLLSNQPPTCQLRWVRPDGRLMARMEAGPKRETPLAGLQAGSWLGQLVALAELLSSGQVGSPNAAQAGGAAWR